MFVCVVPLPRPRSRDYDFQNVKKCIYKYRNEGFLQLRTNFARYFSSIRIQIFTLMLRVTFYLLYAAYLMNELLENHLQHSSI